MTWLQLLYRYIIWTLALGVSLGTAILTLDPYDTGYFALFGAHGVPRFGQRLADVSFGRDQQFDSAIIGNSTMQQIDPAHIGGSPHRTVSLAIPGTGPREQLSVADYFLRHHPGDKTHALIIGLDRWCETGPPVLVHPFPFWLYSDNRNVYLANVMQYQTLEFTKRKIALMLGFIQPMHADGYNDYDAGRAWDQTGFKERLAAPAEDAMRTPASGSPYHFDAATLLQKFLAKLPANAKVVLVVPPRYRPGSKDNDAQRQNACAATFRDIAAQHPHTVFLDFLIRNDLTWRDEDYWDRQHYRTRVARVMEGEINTALNSSK